MRIERIGSSQTKYAINTFSVGIKEEKFLISSSAMKRFFISPPLAAISLIWMAPVQTCARYITMETKTQTTISGDALLIDIHLTNKGDESARSVYVKAITPIETSSSQPLGEFPPSAQHNIKLRHSLKSFTPGTHSLSIQTGYSDTNGYPFSALSVTTFSWKKNAAAGVLGILEDRHLKKKVRTRLRLKNIDAVPKQIRVRLLVPFQLSAEPEESSVHMETGAEQQLFFTLRNFSALPGSTYQIYAVMEYDQAGTHYTSLAPSSIKILEPDLLAADGKALGLMLSVVLILAGLILGRIVLEKRKNQQTRTARSSLPKTS